MESKGCETGILYPVDALLPVQAEYYISTQGSFQIQTGTLINIK